MNKGGSELLPFNNIAPAAATLIHTSCTGPLNSNATQ
jgi:hypothetical protein